MSTATDKANYLFQAQGVHALCKPQTQHHTGLMFRVPLRNLIEGLVCLTKEADASATRDPHRCQVGTRGREAVGFNRIVFLLTHPNSDKNTTQRGVAQQTPHAISRSPAPC